MVITMATVVGTHPKSHANSSTSSSNLLVSRKGTLNRMEESFATADTASMTAESSSESSVSNSEADNLYGYGEGSPDRAAFTSPVKVPFPKSTNKNQQQQQQQQQHRLPPPQRIRSRRASFNDLPPPGFAGSGETPNFLEEYMKMAAVDETNDDDDDDDSDDGMLSHLLSKSRTPVRRRSSMPFSLTNSGDLSDAIAAAALECSEAFVAEAKKKQRELPRKSKQDELGMALKSDAMNGIDFSSRDRPRRPNGYDNHKERDVLHNSPPFVSPTTMKKQSAEIERIDRRPSYANSRDSSSTRISRSSQYLDGEEEIVFGDDDERSESTGKMYIESSEKSYSAPVIFSPTQYRRSKAFNGDDESSSSFHHNANRSDRHYLESSSRSNLATSNRHYMDSSTRTSFVSPTNRSSFEFSSRSSLESSFRSPLDSSSKSLLASSFRGPLDSSAKSVLASSSRSYISVQSRDPGMPKSTMPQFVYSVKYKRGTSNAILGPELSRRSGDLPIGTYVKVQGDRGLNLGIVVGKISLHKYDPSEEEEQVQNLKKVVALANQEEVSAVPEIREEEKELLQLCRRMVFQMGLPMTVVDAELQFDREKITFYYESERRVDHRGLVRWLYSILGIRIWMCQTFKPPPRPFSQYGKGKGKQPVEPSAPIIAPVSEWSS